MSVVQAAQVDDLHLQLETVTRLGSGAEGVVLLAHHLTEERFVAVKKIEVVGVEELGPLETQVKQLTKLRHDNLVKHEDYYIQNSDTKEIYHKKSTSVTPDASSPGRHRDSGRIATNFFNFDDEKQQYSVCLVMEYCNCQTLDTLLREGTFRAGDVITWVFQIAEGLQFLHEQGIVHRDIKPSNIFFHDLSMGDKALAPAIWTPERADRTRVKIGDFGLVKVLASRLASTRVGTLCFMSPEMLTSYGHDTSADIWSLGIVVLLLMIHLKNRKNHYETNQEFLRKFRAKLIMNQGQQNLAVRLRLYNDFVGLFPQKLCVIMFECLKSSPEQRPRACELVAFIKGKRPFMSVDPMSVDDWEDKFFGGPQVNLSTTHLVQLKNDLARDFWKSFFGEYSFRVDWRSFSGAYQSQFTRLGIPNARGLKKILCGSLSQVVTIYHLADCIAAFGFPFQSRQLEFIEKFCIGQGDLEENSPLRKRKSLRKSLKMKRRSLRSLRLAAEEEEEGEVGEEEGEVMRDLEIGEAKFFEMYHDHNNEMRDVYVDVKMLRSPGKDLGSIQVQQLLNLGTDVVVPIDLEKEVFSRDPLRLIVYARPCCGKTVLLKTIAYRCAKRQKQIVPIYVDVALLAENFEKDVPFFLQCMRARPLYRFIPQIEKFLSLKFERKEVLLLFDGIHSCFSEELKSVIALKVLELAENLAGSKSGVILSSRVQLPHFEEAGFEPVHLPMLSDEQVEELARIHEFPPSFKTEVLDRYRNMLNSVPAFLRMTIAHWTDKMGSARHRAPVGLLQLSLGRRVLNYKKIFHDGVQIMGNVVEKLLDRFVRRWESFMMEKAHLQFFLSELARRLMQVRVREFTEETLAPWDGILCDFRQARRFIHSGYHDFIEFDAVRERYRFTFPGFQEYLASISPLVVLRSGIDAYVKRKREITHYSRFRRWKIEFDPLKFPKSKKELKMLKKRRRKKKKDRESGESVTESGDPVKAIWMIDPWTAQVAEYAYLKLEEEQVPVLVKFLMRQDEMPLFIAENFVSVLLTKRESRSCDSQVYDRIQSFLLKTCRKQKARSVQELFFGLGHANEYVRVFAVRLYNLMRPLGLITFEHVVFGVTRAEYDDADSMGLSLEEVLNLKQKKDLMMKLVMLCRKARRRSVIRYLKILKFLRTQDSAAQPFVEGLLKKFACVGTRGEPNELQKTIILDSALILSKLFGKVSTRNEDECMLAQSRPIRDDEDWSALFGLFPRNASAFYLDPSAWRRALDCLRGIKQQAEAEKRREKRRKWEEMVGVCVLNHDLRKLLDEGDVGNLKDFLEGIKESRESLLNGMRLLISRDDLLADGTVFGQVYLFCRTLISGFPAPDLAVRRIICEILGRVTNPAYAHGTCEIFLRRIEEEDHPPLRIRCVELLAEVLCRQCDVPDSQAFLEPVEEEELGEVGVPAGEGPSEDDRMSSVVYLIPYMLNELLRVYVAHGRLHEAVFCAIMRLVRKCDRRLDFSGLSPDRFRLIVEAGTFHSDYIALALYFFGVLPK